MKAKKAAPPRRRVSFAVDRDEIDISSDWVQAVMATPATPSPHPETTPAPPVLAASLLNNATGAENAAGAPDATVEQCSSVENAASVAHDVSVAANTPVEEQATVAASVEVIETTAPAPRHLDDATVEQEESVAGFSTVDATELTSTELHLAPLPSTRKPRPRPIHRITDGLTPGQYAVYSLMFEAGEPDPGGDRIYSGGYADLCRLTGLSKRGIQNIVAELKAKSVIRLHQAPGYHRTETSAYRVPPAAAVLNQWLSLGLRFAIGKSKTLAAMAIV
jgi:hypothetical protein